MAGLYIHIPFCKQACHYCDFHFSTNQDIKAKLIQGIARELVIQNNYLNGEIISTIYFGGGTPSLLTEPELEIIFNSIYTNFTVATTAEVTLEANPDDLSLKKLIALRQSGVNRLSIGIQSFDDAILKFLNRAHSSASAIQCIGEAREAGFKNLSLDLIYAIPNQNDEAWKENIRCAIALKPEHISSYALTIEEKTAFGRWSATGKLKAVDDEIAATQLEILMAELGREGFEQYEVSNFGKPGFYSNHNSSYWKQEKYLGVGPSAHSYNGISRQFNIRNNNLYMKSLQHDEVPFEIEILSMEDKINEYLLTTLRTGWGSDLGKLKNDFGYNILEIHQDYINLLRTRRLAEIVKGALILTNAGKLLADKIASDLFLLK